MVAIPRPGSARGRRLEMARSPEAALRESMAEIKIDRELLKFCFELEPTEPTFPVMQMS